MVKLKYRDLKGNEQELEIKSIEFLHFSNTALVIDCEGNSYEIDIHRIWRIEN